MVQKSFCCSFCKMSQNVSKMLTTIVKAKCWPNFKKDIKKNDFWTILVFFLLQAKKSVGPHNHGIMSRLLLIWSWSKANLFIFYWASDFILFRDIFARYHATPTLHATQPWELWQCRTNEPWPRGTCLTGTRHVAKQESWGTRYNPPPVMFVDCGFFCTILTSVEQNQFPEISWNFQWFPWNLFNKI